MFIRFPLVIRLSIGLHLLWGVLIWFEPEIMFITALYVLGKRALSTSVVLLVSAGFALLPFYCVLGRWQTAICCLPQQIVLYISAMGAMTAAFHGMYGDGILHPRLFIFADQFVHVAIAYYHTKAVIATALERRKP